MERMESLIREGKKAPDIPLKLKSDFKPLFNKEEYCQMVEKGKTYIREGDIFQVVLANRLSAEAEGSLLDTYRVLRTLNPSPYMFFFSGDDIELAGSSPETLTRLENGDLFTFPLAGSRPRGKTPEEDQALEDELLHNTKELAEHNMLVDLGRNDLGRISEFGSVHVERYLDVLRFSHIMHIGSTVHSTIRKDKTLSTPLHRSCRPAPCQGHRRSGPAKSSTNWKPINAASMAAPSDTSTYGQYGLLHRHPPGL